MLAKRIIPCLDVDHGRVVKGKKFKSIQDVADPVELARRYSLEGADELVFYDITASSEDREIFIETVERVAEQVRIPFTIGGGIRTPDDFRKVLLAGADKVSVNTAAVLNPELISEAAGIYGSQCVVLSIDAKNQGDHWEVFVHGGRTPTGIDVVEWAKRGEALGAGEICLNAIDADGVKNGYAINITKEVSEAVRIPIIASGGAGQMKHFEDVLKAGADAALAASVFHYNTIPIQDLKQYLRDSGLIIR